MKKQFSSPAIMLILGFIIALACACEDHPENSTFLIPNTCINSTRQVDARVDMLKAKREMSDGPTILAYIAIAAIIVIPQIPQIDV